MSRSKQVLEKVRRRNDEAKSEMTGAANVGEVCKAHSSITHGIQAAMGNQEDIVEAIVDSRNGAASVSIGPVKITTNNVKDLLRVAQFAIIVYIALVMFGILPSPAKLIHKEIHEGKPEIATNTTVVR